MVWLLISSELITRALIADNKVKPQVFLVGKLLLLKIVSLGTRCICAEDKQWKRKILNLQEFLRFWLLRC